MTRKTLFQSLLCATSICALALSVTPKAHADTTNTGWTSNGLWYTYWADSGNANFTLGGGGNFDVQWNGSVHDFTCGIGWQTGDWRQIGYNCGIFNMSSGAFGMFGVYGWTKHTSANPFDTEYYIVEMSAGNGPGGQWRGTVNADGGTYDIYYSQPMTNGQHNTGIWGAWLEQWISVRRGNAPTGQNRTVSTWLHFNKWQQLGWVMGTWGDQKLGVEGGFGGSGRVNATAWWN